MELFIPCPERLMKMMLQEELRKELLILRCLYHPTIQIMLPTLGTLGTKKRKEKYALSLFEPILNCVGSAKTSG
ncbi:AEG_G0023120.mRNA.1.CDS.1 [Saccharomyces cerevisiae]|nr:hypothetical protein H835_YJM1592B00407 [Saccharomyces cerevisiae YJM1592]AJP96047.1 hypothetical protein H781_YJM1133B00408 [Saccharomyces cerevisiae YJM1133]AJP96430.1 hypothetical protein H782_YJM1190B00407 [Saccharomyces cerevisiae YJM1190]AJQ15583.1 hypothetical protein H809_YJM1389B00399 [Saccharomyces cerevisiae YJM1389]CAI4514448.1 AEG_G0023120.mRNA.1.CDS.1 [Saccharomyces cerevisiae]